MRRFIPTSTALVLLGVVLPSAVSAQDGYLFRKPSVTVALRLGAAVPNTSDDIYDFFTEELTLDRKDFTSAVFGMDLAAHVNPQLDVVLGIGTAASSKRSEFRDWVDQDDLPIEQTTRLIRVPITAGLKYYLVERGRSVGRYAYVPAKVLPYIGAGGGLQWYELKQEGDFIDHETLEVFTDRLVSSGTTPTAHVMAGAEWWFSTRFGLTVDGRYSWSKSDLDRDFSDFDKINLSGVQLTTGLSVRF